MSTLAIPGIDKVDETKGMSFGRIVDIVDEAGGTLSGYSNQEITDAVTLLLCAVWYQLGRGRGVLTLEQTAKVNSNTIENTHLVINSINEFAKNRKVGSIIDFEANSAKALEIAADETRLNNARDAAIVAAGRATKKHLEKKANAKLLSAFMFEVTMWILTDPDFKCE